MQNGLYDKHLKRVNKINEYYAIYDGEQEWQLKTGLDYKPSRIITNYIQKIIGERAKFMFGREPFFDVRPLGKDERSDQIAQNKEDVLAEILDSNKFHKKLMQGYKDSKIAGNVGIKLWGNTEDGIRIIFVPAQEYFIEHDIDDIDSFTAVTFFHLLQDDDDKQNQRVRKQRMYLENGICYLDEIIADGYGKIVEVVYDKHDTGLEFIPFINIVNGGLTGTIEGESEVAKLWDNQNAYNQLQSDDIDAMKFQMFGQTVVKNASEDTLKNLVIAPGAVVDLQGDIFSGDMKDNTDMFRVESSFSYGDQLEETLKRIKGNMFDLLDVPNVSTEQLRGLMSSGKSMEALYWGLIAACDEDWTEWRPQLRHMAEMIFTMIDTYNITKYGPIEGMSEPTGLQIENYYPLIEDELEQKQLDLEEVTTEVRSRRSYMDKWGNYENVDKELEDIESERVEEDTYSGFGNLLQEDGLTIDV